MTKTSIEWATDVWNPVTGCTKVSAGCKNCYAEKIAKRFWGDRKFTDVQCHEERLYEPFHWKKPRRVFVNSMSDLFHPDVPFGFITEVFDVMNSWRWPNKAAERSGDYEDLVDPGHTFMVLTKRPERIQTWLNWVDQNWPSNSPLNIERSVCGNLGHNVWLGVSVENQRTAHERIPLLLQTPAAVRFVSVEPMLEWLDLTWWTEKCPECGELPSLVSHWRWDGQSWAHYHGYPIGHIPTIRSKSLDWVICGSESGPSARPFETDWARYLRNQCQRASVPFFLKQMPVNGKLVKMPELDGKVWSEIPEAFKYG